MTLNPNPQPTAKEAREALDEVKAAALADGCEQEWYILRAFIDSAEAAMEDATKLQAVRDLLWTEHPECCGNPTVGAEYMGQQEMVCCGCPESAMLNDAQIVASLRAMFPEGGFQQTPTPKAIEDATAALAELSRVLNPKEPSK